MRSAAESEGSVGLPSRRPAGCWTFGTEVRMRDGPETVRLKVREQSHGGGKHRQGENDSCEEKKP